MRKLLAIAALSLLSGVVACSSADDDPTDPESETTAPADDEAGGDATGTTPTTGDGEEGGEAEGGEAEGEGGGGAAEGEVLGTATARLAADPNDPTLVPVRLDVVALERLEGMVELRAVLTNEGRRDIPAWEPYSAFDDPRLSGEGTYSLSGASLVDGEAQQAYLALIDSEGACLCSRRMDQVSLPPGESLEVYADFGGVPDDIEAIDVQVPGFSTVAQVAIG